MPCKVCEGIICLRRLRAGDIDIEIKWFVNSLVSVLFCQDSESSEFQPLLIRFITETSDLEQISPEDSSVL